MASLATLLSSARAGLSASGRQRVAASGAAGLVAAVMLLAGWGDPSRALASARTEMPVWTLPVDLAEAETDHGAEHADGHDASASDVDAHTQLASLNSSGAHGRPRPLLRPGSDDAAAPHDPLIDLRPAVDHATEPRLDGIEDLGGAHTAHAATPTHAPDHGSDNGTGHGVAQLQVAWNGEGLRPAPIEALARSGPGGLLPRVAPDGRTPAAAYARPFDDDGEAPLIGVVIGGLGLNAAVTRQAITSLPPEITLSFVPYATHLQDWIDQARAAGHEVLLELPMEPYDYPSNDPGPHTLLANADPDENRRRLEWLMSRATGYFGVMNYLGAKFTASPEAMEPTLAMIAESGVAFLYDGETQRTHLAAQAAHAGLDSASADRILDARPSATAIDEQLLTLEALAIQNGDALGAGFGYPVTVSQVESWTGLLEFQGYRLAPVSAILARRAADTRLELAQAEPELGAPDITFSSMRAGFGANRNAPPEELDAGGGHGGGDDAPAADSGHH